MTMQWSLGMITDGDSVHINATDTDTSMSATVTMKVEGRHEC